MGRTSALAERAPPGGWLQHGSKAHVKGFLFLPSSIESEGNESAFG